MSGRFPFDVSLHEWSLMVDPLHGSKTPKHEETSWGVRSRRGDTSRNRREQLSMVCYQERILTRIHYHLNPDAREEDCTLAECIPHQHFAMKMTEQVLYFAH